MDLTNIKHTSLQSLNILISDLSSPINQLDSQTLGIHIDKACKPSSIEFIFKRFSLVFSNDLISLTNFQILTQENGDITYDFVDYNNVAIKNLKNKSFENNNSTEQDTYFNKLIIFLNRLCVSAYYFKDEYKSQNMKILSPECQDLLFNKLSLHKDVCYFLVHSLNELERFTVTVNLLYRLQFQLLIDEIPDSAKHFEEVIRRNDLKGLENLIDHSNTSVIIDDDRMTPLLMAANYGRYEIMKKLIETGFYNVKDTDKNGDNALIYVCKNNHPSCIKLLLDIGIDVNFCDGITPLTPLMYAASLGHVGCIQQLIESKAIIDLKEPEYGETSIMLAASSGHTQAVKKLIESGANLTILSNKGWNALYYAVQGGEIGCILAMLQEKFHKIDLVDYPAGTEIWPLLIASFKGNLYILEFLLQLGANANAKSALGEYALHQSVMVAHYECILKLVQFGANLNTNFNDDSSILMQGVVPIRKKEFVTENFIFMIENGANVNYEDSEGNNIALIACQFGSYTALQILIDHGININHQNKYGWTALMVAAQYGFTNCIKLLYENQARIDILENKGRKAVDIASLYFQKQCHKLLIQYENI